MNTQTFSFQSFTAKWRGEMTTNKENFTHLIEKKYPWEWGP